VTVIVGLGVQVLTSETTGFIVWVLDSDSDVGEFFIGRFVRNGTMLASPGCEARQEVTHKRINRVSSAILLFAMTISFIPDKPIVRHMCTRYSPFTAFSLLSIIKALYLLLGCVNPVAVYAE
jgi:hypothetical protein